MAHCTIERLMRANGVRGAGDRTTVADDQAVRAPECVDRDLRAACPNWLGLVDFTYVPTWTGTDRTACVADVFSRRILGWRTAPWTRTDLPLP